MSTFYLSGFGEIDLENVEDYFDVEIEFNGQIVKIDINFENSSINATRLELVSKFIDNLSLHNSNNKKRIVEDFQDENCDTVQTYVSFALSECDLTGIVDSNYRDKSPEQQIIDSLTLLRVVLHPDSDEQFASFDYSLGEEVIGDLLVIFTNVDGEMDYMTVES